MMLKPHAIQVRRMAAVLQSVSLFTSRSREQLASDTLYLQVIVYVAIARRIPFAFIQSALQTTAEAVEWAAHESSQRFPSDILFRSNVSLVDQFAERYETQDRKDNPQAFSL